jgi:hypothetical protein
VKDDKALVDPKKSLYHDFIGICAAFLMGNYRLNKALVVLSTTSILFFQNQIEELRPSHKQIDNTIFSEIKKLKPVDFECFRYVSDGSYITYLVSVFEAFIDGVIKFMMVNFPGPVKNTLSADYNMIFSSSDIHELKNKVIEKKCRELSFASLRDRMRFLRTSYKLSPKIDAATWRYIDKLYIIRNSFVHEQSHIDIVYKDDGVLGLEQKRCPLKPTNIPEGFLQEAIGKIEVFVFPVMEYVIRDVIKYKDTKDFYKIMSILSSDN